MFKLLVRLIDLLYLYLAIIHECMTCAKDCICGFLCTIINTKIYVIYNIFFLYFGTFSGRESSVRLFKAA